MTPDSRATQARWGWAPLVLAAAAVGGVRWLQVGAGEGAITATLLLVTGAAALTAAQLFARRDGERAVTRRLTVGVGVTVGLALAGIGVVGGLTFMTREEAVTFVLLLAFAAVLAHVCGRILGGALARDLRGLQAALEAVDTASAPEQFGTGRYAEMDDVAQAGSLMVERLARREAARLAAEVERRDLFASISHDLRTPLATLRLLADAITDEVDPEVRVRYLRRLGTNVDALRSLVDDLFELARLEAGEVRWATRPVALEDLVEETVEAFLAAAEAKRVALGVEMPADLPRAEAAPEKLQRVFFNLIHNALRHTPPQGTVTVRARGAGDRLEIEVADTGEGIDPDERDRVFEPFYRRAGSAPGAGAGLGLAISRGIVLAHGGRIWIADGAAGTRICFTLPRAPAGSAPATWRRTSSIA